MADIIMRWRRLHYGYDTTCEETVDRIVAQDTAKRLSWQKYG